MNERSVGLDALLTFLMPSILGPSAFKLRGLGPVGWATRLPLDLLRLEIGLGVLLTPDSARWYMTGPLLGAALTMFLSLGSTVPGGPAAEKCST
jgi:hypothetical protein